MKKTIFTLLCGLSIFLAACGSLGGSGIQLKYNDTERTMEAKSAFVAPGSSGTHSIQITNYPVEMGDSYSYSKINAKEEGQFRLDVVIVKQRAEGSQPVVAGEYKPQPSNQEPKDKFVKATIYRFENGKEVPVELDYKNLQGVVKITSVEGETAKGSIDATDGKNVIKGDFTAKILK